MGRKHKGSGGLGSAGKLYRKSYTYVGTWEGLERVRKDIRAAEGIDKRCGEHGPRSKKVTLPHVSIQDEPNET